MTEERHGKVINKQKFTVVGLRHRATAGSEQLKQLWQQLNERMAELEHLPQTGDFYGLIDNFDEDSGKFDYMAGAEVEAVDDVPDGMDVWVVDAQNYLVFKTSLSQLMDTYRHINETWLPNSNYRRLPATEFEYYGDAFHPDDPESEMYVYIPVEPLAGGE